jgi:hypothetical protein
VAARHRWLRRRRRGKKTRADLGGEWCDDGGEGEEKRGRIGGVGRVGWIGNQMVVGGDGGADGGGGAVKERKLSYR